MTKISKAPRTKKTNAAVIVPLVLKHAEFLDLSHEQGLSDLIASLNAPEVTQDVPTDIIDAAVSGIEAIEVSMDMALPGEVLPGAAPTIETKAAKAVKKSKAVKAAKEPAAAKVPTVRKFYTDKTERLKDKLGDDLAGYSVLTLKYADVADGELIGVMESTMLLIRSMNKKEQNWAVKFIEYMAGKKGTISEVTGRILKVLDRDGFISTGNDGNVFKDLVARPYSPGSARAMGGNNIGMLTDLKLIMADGKGRYIANPDSVLLMKVKSMTAGAPGPVASATPVVAAATPESVNEDEIDHDFLEDLDSEIRAEASADEELEAA